MEYAEMNPKIIVGTWKLMSFVFKTANERNLYPLGENPIGFIFYTLDGHVSVVLSQSGRKPFEQGDLQGTPDEMSYAFQTSLAYAGRYNFDREAVYHHVEVSNFPNWTGISQTRYYRIEANRLMLTSPSIFYQGHNGILDLVLERVL